MPLLERRRIELLKPHQCIFCENLLNESTKLEHILLSALGGKKTSKRLICSDCNGHFGSTIDEHFAEQVAELRNLMQFRSGKGHEPPMLRGLRSGENIINIRRDGTPEISGKPFVVNRQADGLVTVHIQTRSVEDIVRFVPDIAAKIGLTAEELLEKLDLRQISVSDQRPDILYCPSFGGETAIRSMVKSSLELWALHVGNHEVRSDAYAEARRFVNQGGADFADTRVQLDSRALPDIEKVLRQYGPTFNMIYIQSDGTGRVIAHFTLYNMVSWQVVLSYAGNNPTSKVGLVSNPGDPTKWSDKIAGELEIPFSWLEKPAYSDEEGKTRFGAALALYFGPARSRAIGEIVADVFKRGLAAGETEFNVAMIDEIIERIAALQLGIRYSRQMTKGEWDNLFRIIGVTADR